MENHEKILKLANLANSSQRQLLQLKDLSAQLIQTNEEIRSVIIQMEEREDIIIAASGTGKQMIARVDPSVQVEVPENPNEPIVLEPLEVVDTWAKVEQYFPPEVTERAKSLAERVSKLIEEAEANVKILNKFIEDWQALMETMVEDFHANELQMQGLESHLADVRENLDATQRVLSDLQAVRDIFPYHETLNPQELLMRSHEREEREKEENGPIEENRPFPNAWTE